MEYEEFKKAYTEAFNRMMSYKNSECGSEFYANEMAKLSDNFPEFEIRLELELA